ncbi:MAG: 3-isopropylmalate dehydrogenase [SAR324 cluster bacterium]|nr:3-isopropylmalate dehydrogenase [SAR324 cluster bacterium]
MGKKILVMKGDHIGPEVTDQGLKVLHVMAAKTGVELELEADLLGGCSIDVHGIALTDEAYAKAEAADAILFGAAGGPDWDGMRFKRKKQRDGLLALRKGLDLFANLRAVKVFDSAVDASTLKPEHVRGADVMILRELTGGIYFGEPRGIREEDGERFALNTMIYTEKEVRRIVRRGCEIARKRSGKLMSVDKANATEVGRFWRDIATEVAADYPDVEFDSMYVDNAAMQIIRNPRQFDTIVTGNMFGDILSDAAGNLTGSLGMLPSASLGENHALYEPCHGSAPDISGRDIANPVASILSVGMLFRYTLDKPEADEAIHRAVEQVLATHRTADIMAEGKNQVGCSQMGDLIVQHLEEQP